MLAPPARDVTTRRTRNRCSVTAVKPASWPPTGPVEGCASAGPDRYPFRNSGMSRSSSSSTGRRPLPVGAGAARAIGGAGSDRLTAGAGAYGELDWYGEAVAGD